jgi:M6 family metalloprotease-like protein
MKKHRFIIVSLLLSLVTLTVVAQEDMPLRGCRVGTPRPEGIALRRGASGGQPKQAGGDFYHGERHQLTILAAFNDRLFKGDEAATITQWNKIFNTENLTENPFKGSVHDYFMDQSYGDFNLVFDLVYVQVSGNAEKYASTRADDENSQYLVQDILEVLKTRNIDWSLYDWNGDGFINQLLVIYAGHGMNDSSGSNLIWPHQWWMSEHLKDKQEGVYCDPIPVNYGGKNYKVDCYCALAELTKNDDYGSFGTICHEYTHCFGFPDFYSDGGLVVGSWDLMDYGNYNGSGYCPPGYSAHERWLMGWLTPIELSEATTITDMPQLAEQPVAYLVRNDRWQDEYYFIENRQKIGWDATIPGQGVVVFHIDYDPSIWTSTTIMPNSSSYKRYNIFPANNKTSSYYVTGWAYPYSGNNQLTNVSTPAATLNHQNTDGTKLMSKPITNMKVTGGLASFDFMGGTPSGICSQQPSASSSHPSVLYRMGDIYIIRNAQGKIVKVNTANSILKLQ